MHYVCANKIDSIKEEIKDKELIIESKKSLIKGFEDDIKKESVAITKVKEKITKIELIIKEIDKRNKFKQEYDNIPMHIENIDLVGSASATASVQYNINISERRNDSVLKWLGKQEVSGKTIQNYIDDGSLKLKFTPRGEEIVIPKTNSEAQQSSDTNDIALVNSSGKDSFLTDSVDCRVNVREKVAGTTNQYKRTSFAEWYSIPPMACRRVAIQAVRAKVPPKKEEIVTTTDGGGGNNNDNGVNEEITVNDPQTNPSTPIKPSPNITVEQKIKDGISKKILRFLFSECDYFEVLKENDPMIFQSIKDKIKYFNPAFHSTTPEGLNARITFLNQCVRPGQTIPIIGADGRPKYNDALNTSFGAPPILVIRVGDFYHSL